MKGIRGYITFFLIGLMIGGLGSSPSRATGESKVFLLIGVESNRFRRSDTLMVARFDSEQRMIHLLSIPRDTLVTIPGKGPGKVNQAYPWGGIPLVRKTVEEFLKVKVDHVVKVNFGGFRPIINAVGGVPVQVKEQLDYDDDAGRLHIHLKPGNRVLDGEEALGYVRFRMGDPEYDIGRIKRQQQFLRAFLKRATEPKNIVRIPALVHYLFDCIETDLTLLERISFARQIFTARQMTCEVVPGEPKMLYGRSYWVPDARYLAAMKH